QMTITDANGNVAFALTAPAGQTVTGPGVLLVPGAYSVRLTAVLPAGALAALTFELYGASISDPVGPVISDPTNSPMYTNPGNPSVYYYPDGTVSQNPFLLVSIAL